VKKIYSDILVLYELNQTVSDFKIYSVIANVSEIVKVGESIDYTSHVA